MNHARRHRHGTMIGCLAFVALAGCAEYKAENPALTEYPGIQSQIENFYDANATEDDWVCDSPQMNTIDKSQVVEPVGDPGPDRGHLLLPVERPARDRAANQCQGFNTRFFTFDKGPGGQLSLVSMSGAQRGVNG